MDTIVKSFTGLFFLLMLTALGLSLSSSAAASRAADRYASTCKSRIEAAHLAEDVIRECAAEAETKGYLLEVAVTGRAADGRKYGVLELYYNAPVTFFGNGSADAVETAEDYTEVVSMDLS